MEFWDVYDEDRNRTGRIKARGDKIEADEYMLAVISWLRSGEGKWLVTRRDERKSSFPLCWETPGGCAVAGEDSLTAAMREIREETGIELRPEQGTLLRSYRRAGEPGWENPGFLDVWVFSVEPEQERVRLRPGETCDALWATKEEILRLIGEGSFTPTEEVPHHLDLFREYP